MARIVLKGIRWIYYALLCIGTTALALFLWHYFEATYYQAQYERAFEQLETERLDGLSADNREREDVGASRGSSLEQGSRLEDLVGRLEIGRIDLDVMVLKGADAAALRRGAGWIRRTAKPGEPGNMGIAGHRDTHFRPLEQIRKGDRIILTTTDGRHNEYRVAWITVVEPSQVEVLDATSAPALTLVTCYPFNYVGRAPKRFVVRAVRISG